MRKSYYLYEFYNVRFEEWFQVETLDFLNDEIGHICNCGGVHWVHEQDIAKHLKDGTLRLRKNFEYCGMKD